MENSVDRLRREVVACIKRKRPNQRLTIEFRHDVYNYLFHGKGTPGEQKSWTTFEEGDLNLCPPEPVPPLNSLRIGTVCLIRMGMG